MNLFRPLKFNVLESISMFTDYLGLNDPILRLMGASTGHKPPVPC